MALEPVVGDKTSVTIGSPQFTFPSFLHVAIPSTSQDREDNQQGELRADITFSSYCYHDRDNIASGTFVLRGKSLWWYLTCLICFLMKAFLMLLIRKCIAVSFTYIICKNYYLHSPVCQCLQQYLYCNLTQQWCVKVANGLKALFYLLYFFCISIIKQKFKETTLGWTLTECIILSWLSRHVDLLIIYPYFLCSRPFISPLKHANRAHTYFGSLLCLQWDKRRNHNSSWRSRLCS